MERIKMQDAKIHTGDILLGKEVYEIPYDKENKYDGIVLTDFLLDGICSKNLTCKFCKYNPNKNHYDLCVSNDEGKTFFITEKFICGKIVYKDAKLSFEKFE